MLSCVNRRAHRLRKFRGASSIFLRKSSNILLVVIIAGFVGTLWSGQPPVNVDASSTYNVSIVSYLFRPQSINVTTGTDVVWTFLTNGTDSSDVHTVTSDNQTQSGGGIFQSLIMHAGQTFSFTFYSPGKYPYHCSVHPLMIGLVNVTGPALNPPSETGSLFLYVGAGVVVAVAVIGVVVFYLRNKGRAEKTSGAATGRPEST